MKIMLVTYQVNLHHSQDTVEEAQCQMEYNQETLEVINLEQLAIKVLVVLELQALNGVMA